MRGTRYKRPCFRNETPKTVQNGQNWVNFESSCKGSVFWLPMPTRRFLEGKRAVFGVFGQFLAFLTIFRVFRVPKEKCRGGPSTNKKGVPIYIHIHIYIERERESEWVSGWVGEWVGWLGCWVPRDARAVLKSWKVGRILKVFWKFFSRKHRFGPFSLRIWGSARIQHV